MYIYNITTKVEHSIADAWLQWMKDTHIPGFIATGCFSHAVILEVMEVDNTEGPTYAVQYHAESRSLYNRFIQQYSDAMSKASHDKWGGSVISFRSVLRVV